MKTFIISIIVMFLLLILAFDITYTSKGEAIERSGLPEWTGEVEESMTISRCGSGDWVVYYFSYEHNHIIVEDGNSYVYDNQGNYLCGMGGWIGFECGIPLDNCVEIYTPEDKGWFKKSTNEQTEPKNRNVFNSQQEKLLIWPENIRINKHFFVTVRNVFDDEEEFQLEVENKKGNLSFSVDYPNGPFLLAPDEYKVLWLNFTSKNKGHSIVEFSVYANNSLYDTKSGFLIVQ